MTETVTGHTNISGPSLVLAIKSVIAVSINHLADLLVFLNLSHICAMVRLTKFCKLFLLSEAFSAKL